MASEIERHQPTKLERQATWDQHANDLVERYAGFTDAESLTDEEKIIALVSLVPMALSVIEEARDTIERLNGEVERSVTETDIDLLYDCAVVCQRHGLDGTARRLLALADRLDK